MLGKLQTYKLQTPTFYEKGLVVKFWPCISVCVSVSSDGKAKEVISRYNSDIDSADLFYTDSNGRQMMERKYWYRPIETVRERT